MATFTLNPNEIFGTLFNQIISQEVFSDNLAGVNGSELLVYVNGEKSTGNVSVEGDVITVDT